MRHVLTATALWLFTAFAAVAQSAADIDRLVKALDLPGVIAVMREEGLQTGREMGAEMFSSGGAVRWNQIVEQIYDPEWMLAQVREGFEASIAGTDITPLLSFFEAPLGQRIIGLELSARKALLDDAVDAASKEKLAEMMAENAPRLDLLEEFISANNLIDLNVAGGLNSNLAFYRGLAAGGSLDPSMTEDRILAEVWAQEQAIRADTEEWLFSYLAMAYQPLTDEELQSYTELSQSEAGRALNRALFAGFDPMFEAISHALGMRSGQMMQSQEL